jgi:hypothetical protein
VDSAVKPPEVCPRSDKRRPSPSRRISCLADTEKEGTVIHYSGWDRPLFIADVKSKEAQNHSGFLSAIFLLKERSHP